MLCISQEDEVQVMSDLQLLIDIINVALVLVLIYCFFSVPAQFIRRFRRKRQGLAVSPAFLVLRNILKYWLLTALIIIPASCGLIFMLGQSAGLDGETIYAVMVTQGVAGNILTSLLLGYVFMKANKENWSEPEAEIKNSVNKLSFIKNLTIVGNDRIKKAKDKALKNTVGFYTKIETEARSIEGKRNHTPEEDARLKLEREISDEASKEEVSRLKREHEKALEDADICNRIDIESIMTREKWADFQEKHFKPIKSLKQRRLLTQFIRRYEREAFPLHKAIWNNDYNLTKTLIFFGCDITLKNSEERSVRDMAAGNVKIIALVEQAIRET
ncbi:hypothetical protein SAMN04488490_1514 [Marinobacter sp. LV10R510-11A]|nr:hypothetical protein SAMN04488490_1514 [Marinobacter sp. LV10R510-11A]